MTRIYVSGPMAGIAGHNLLAFGGATELLTAQGHDAVNPGRHGPDPGMAWSDFLRRDLAELVTCEAVAVLPGWEASRGSRLEISTALTLGMPVRTLAGWLDDDGGHIDAVPVMPTTNEVAAWLNTTFGPVRSITDQTLVLAEEVGEVCRAVVKREQGVRGTPAEWASKVREEIGDVVITCLSVAATEGFDLATAVADRWAVVSTRNATAHRPPAA